MKTLFNRYQDILFYALFGSLASIINILIFNFYHINLGKTLIVSNTIAWFLANLFSFFCNKHIVFKNGKHGYKAYFKEMGTFLSSRLVSWLADMAIMYIGVWILPKHPVVIKIIDQVLIGIFNYTMTKLIFIHNNKSLLNRMKNNKLNKKR